MPILLSLFNGCSTVEYNQSVVRSEYLTNGVIVTTTYINKASANGEGVVKVDKLRVSSTRTGGVSLGAEGAEGEVTSPALSQLIETMKAMMELGKAMAK